MKKSAITAMAVAMAVAVSGPAMAGTKASHNAGNLFEHDSHAAKGLLNAFSHANAHGQLGIENAMAHQAANGSNGC